MVKYKGILLLFCVYVALVLVAIYFSLFLITDMIIFIIFITQVGAAFISIVVFSFYLRAWNIYRIFFDINNLLNENSNWDLMQKFFHRALRLKPTKDEIPSKLSLFLVILGSLLIIISIIMNFILSIGVLKF